MLLKKGDFSASLCLKDFLSWIFQFVAMRTGYTGEKSSRKFEEKEENK